MKKRAIPGTTHKSFSKRRLPIDRYFTVRQVAEFLAYSEKQMRRLCEQGKIRTIQASKGAQHRIPLGALKVFLQQSQSYWAARSDLEFERTVIEALSVAAASGRPTREFSDS